MVKIAGPASVASVRSSKLSGCWLVNTANTTPSKPKGIIELPLPLIDAVSSEYIGALSWFTHPINNGLPASNLTGV
jgi:hypothetical protein